MKKKIFICLALILTALFVFASCGDTQGEATTTGAPQTTKPMPVDPDVSEVLASFYQSTLPQMVFKSGVKDESGKEISCSFDMIQKTAFVDFDSDGKKELVLLYDVSELAGKANMDVAVFLDEKDSQPVVVYVNSGAYGLGDSEQSFLLTYKDDKVCLVKVVKYDSCEAVLVQEYGKNGWTSTTSAYRHISDHDSVKLEENSYYIDHASGGLFNAVTGKSVYSVEKFRNFRIPQEAYDGLLNNFEAMSILP